MRKYIRHPADIPIKYRLEDVVDRTGEYIHDISEGGLSFKSKIPLKKGSSIMIEIPITKPRFKASGEVTWCRKSGDIYNVGVKFLDHETEFRLRMVEQVCHIEHYRKKIREEEGRKLSGEEAAAEWIEKYAEKFPSIDD
jgi:hypothetical protein